MDSVEIIKTELAVSYSVGGDHCFTIFLLNFKILSTRPQMLFIQIFTFNSFKFISISK